ncbi:hypothetical protein VTH06DRAFT_1985 [Thermothelomyces fergusii]
MWANGYVYWFFAAYIHTTARVTASSIRCHSASHRNLSSNSGVHTTYTAPPHHTFFSPIVLPSFASMAQVGQILPHRKQKARCQFGKQDE